MSIKYVAVRQISNILSILIHSSNRLTSKVRELTAKVILITGLCSIQLFKITIFSHFCSKHRLWVHVRTDRLIEAVLTSTHDVSFRAKISKIMYTPVFLTPILLYKSGMRGCINYMDVLS